MRASRLLVWIGLGLGLLAGLIAIAMLIFGVVPA